MTQLRNHAGLARLISLAFVGLVSACAASSDDAADASADEAVTTIATTPTTAATDPGSTDASEARSDAADSAAASTFSIDVWADNWMAVYVDGVLIGEDSVPITTERSFNSESFTFEATYPFTLAIEAKDFKETDSGLEYIGQPSQQMGDGGIIAQVTDMSTGEIVAGTDANWKALVVHQAPLNTACEHDPDPDATCEFLVLETPTDWASPDFDDNDWTNASVWTAADVGPKDGYDDITWDPTAQLIWGIDLHVDNTILLRTTIS